MYIYYAFIIVPGRKKMTIMIYSPIHALKAPEEKYQIKITALVYITRYWTKICLKVDHV
jgi:hypothetical protein